MKLKTVLAWGFDCVGYKVNNAGDVLSVHCTKCLELYEKHRDLYSELNKTWYAAKLIEPYVFGTPTVKRFNFEKHFGTKTHQKALELFPSSSEAPVKKFMQEIVDMEHSPERILNPKKAKTVESWGIECLGYTSDANGTVLSMYCKTCREFFENYNEKYEKLISKQQIMFLKEIYSYATGARAFMKFNFEHHVLKSRSHALAINVCKLSKQDEIIINKACRPRITLVEQPKVQKRTPEDFAAGCKIKDKKPKLCVVIEPE